MEKAKTTDLLTINSIIDKVFPQVSTSLTLGEIMNYATAYSEYTLAGNEGFPFDKSTDTVSGLGSIVIPQDLASNVTKLHQFLFGTEGYTPSSTVQKLSSNIAYTVNSAGGSSGSDSDRDYSSGSGSSGSRGQGGGNGNSSNTNPGSSTSDETPGSGQTPGSSEGTGGQDTPPAQEKPPEGSGSGGGEETGDGSGGGNENGGENAGGGSSGTDDGTGSTESL